MCVVQGTEPAHISMHAIFNQNTHVHEDLIFSTSESMYMCTMVRVAMVASQQWSRLYSYITDDDVSNRTVIQIHAL